MPVQIAEAAMSPTQLAAVAAYTERLQRQMTAIEIAVIADERAAIDKHIEVVARLLEITPAEVRPDLASVLRGGRS